MRAAPCRIRVLVLLMVGLPLASARATVTIDFDRDADGNPIADGTVVNTLYAPLGVTFSRDVAWPTDPEVYASGLADIGVSPPHGISPHGPTTAADFSERGFGRLRAAFDREVSQVCIYVRGQGILRAFGGDGVWIATALDDSLGPARPLCISAPGTRAVHFAGPDRSYGKFDHLTFEPVVCAVDADCDGDQCNGPGVCDAGTGRCAYAPLPDGTPCDTGDASVGMSRSLLNAGERRLG